jgi:hypothetical protein
MSLSRKTKKIDQPIKPLRWLRLDISRPPEQPGIYAIKSGTRWLYVGRAINIAKRIQQSCHPVQITKDLKSMDLTYLWQPASEYVSLAKQENAMIRQCDPDWNGQTEFYGPTKWPSCALLLPVSLETLCQALGDECAFIPPRFAAV